MTEDKFRAEKLYYISLSMAKSMLGKGIIDEEVLAIIDTKLLGKCRPISGTLLAVKPLILSLFRVIYGKGKRVCLEGVILWRKSAG